MTLEKRTMAFAELGRKMQKCLSKDNFGELEVPLKNAQIHNSWFTEDNLLFSIKSVISMLQEEKMQQWTSGYSFNISSNQNPKKILVVMAGNIPLVGFHDFLSVLISGNIFMGKLSSDDLFLLPAISRMLIDIEPEFNDRVLFVDGKAEDFDAVIATGSNNSSRYFDYYFGKYPNIIRRHRSSIAVLTGKEGEDELISLTDDICLYFGMGCRSVSKVFVPDNYDIGILFPVFKKYSKSYTQHNKYLNNFDYNKSIFLLNKTRSIDNGFILFTESPELSSSISVLNYEYYKTIEDVKKYLLSVKDNLQCIIGDASILEGAIPFGKSHRPELWDYADGVDVLNFLAELG